MRLVVEAVVFVVVNVSRGAVERAKHAVREVIVFRNNRGGGDGRGFLCFFIFKRRWRRG